MICHHCQSVMIHTGDEDMEEDDIFSMVSEFTCPECDTMAMVYRPHSLDREDSPEDDIVAKLERIAVMAEMSSHHTADGQTRLMPAAGVADVIHEAMFTIVDLRVDLEVALEDASEAETFVDALLDKGTSQ